MIGPSSGGANGWDKRLPRSVYARSPCHSTRKGPLIENQNQTPEDDGTQQLAEGGDTPGYNKEDGGNNRQPNIS